MSDSVDIVNALGGEAIKYLPAGGAPKTFKAIIERRPTQVQHNHAGAAIPVNTIEVLIPNDATNGVTRVQVRKDKMTFKENISDSQTSDFTVMKVTQEDTGLVATDGGMFRCEVQS